MTIQIPHKFKPRIYQIPILKAFDKGCKRAVIVWNRRSGKDKTILQIVIKEMLKKVGTYYYIFPTYSQGRKILWDGIDKSGMRFIEHFPKELISGIPNETEMRIELVNGSAFQIIGVDKIDNIVGTNPIGCVFSEYPLQKPKGWDFIRPILAENGGWAIFDFTPRGMNHGWKILQQAKSEGWFWQVLTVEDTQAIPADVLEAEKRTMPQALFEQEYYCKFIEGAGQFFKRIDENIWSGELSYDLGHIYRLGVDLAKYQDWTVITPIDLTETFKIGKQERFNQIDYNLQKSRIEATCRKYGLAQSRIDSTGVGEPINDDLVARGLPIEPFHFTEQSRKDLLNNLQIKLAQDMIKIPDDEILISELKSFQYSLAENGKLKIGVPEGLHDDCVMSLALAVWDLPLYPNNPKPNKSEEFNLYNNNYK